MIVQALGAPGRLLVVDFGHFELWHGEANQVRSFDGVFFAVSSGMRSYDLEQRNVDQILLGLAQVVLL